MTMTEPHSHVVHNGKREMTIDELAASQPGMDRLMAEMLGKQEAVVRPLDDYLVRVVGMAGATDLGDGRPTLVLDLASLGASLVQNSEAGV